MIFKVCVLSFAPSDVCRGEHQNFQVENMTYGNASFILSRVIIQFASYVDGIVCGHLHDAQTGFSHQYLLHIAITAMFLFAMVS